MGRNEHTRDCEGKNSGLCCDSAYNGKHSYKNTGKKTKQTMNSKNILVRFLKKYWCPCRYYHNGPFSTEILPLSGLYFILTHNMCLAGVLLCSPQHLNLCPCNGRLVG